jgi:hypothetical protein
MVWRFDYDDWKKPVVMTIIDRCSSVCYYETLMSLMVTLNYRK